MATISSSLPQTNTAVTTAPKTTVVAQSTVGAELAQPHILTALSELLSSTCKRELRRRNLNMFVGRGCQLERDCIRLGPPP